MEKMQLKVGPSMSGDQELGGMQDKIMPLLSSSSSIPLYSLCAHRIT